MKIYYDPELKERAKILRKRSTLPEVLLWNHLQAKKMMGFRFHRQKPIDHYIVDFFCKPLRLIIEIDGPCHDYKDVREKKRDDRLKSFGYNMLRFRNDEVMKNIDRVLLVIRQWISDHESL